MRDPVAFLEVDGVQRTAPAAPVVRAAAEIAQARGDERKVLHPRASAGIKRLGRGVELHAAAFEQGDVERGVGEGERQGDAGRAAAEDRQVRPENGACLNGSRVDESAQDLNPVRRLTQGRKNFSVLSEMSPDRKRRRTTPNPRKSARTRVKYIN